MDEGKVQELAFRVVGDMAGAFAMGMGYMGDRLGLFKALAEGPATSAQLAERSGLNERYVREWGEAMVAAEYIDYDEAARSFSMTTEQSLVLADEESPAFVGGAFHFTIPSLYNVPKVMDCFKNGGGVSYSDLGEEIPESIERFFKPGYKHFLASQWMPTVPGLAEQLAQGGAVGDVGCGCGQSTVAMAKAFPNATFTGVDVDGSSIERAKALASSESVSNAEFLHGPAEEQLEADSYDLVCAFDCVHDMVDPVGTLRTIREALKEGGRCFVIEPNGSDKPLENRNPVGKVFANISALHCMTVSLAHGGAGHGTLLGEAGVAALATEAGFSACERLPIEHPFNMFFALTK